MKTKFNLFDFLFGTKKEEPKVVEKKKETKKTDDIEYEVYEEVTYIFPDSEEDKEDNKSNKQIKKIDTPSYEEENEEYIVKDKTIDALNIKNAIINQVEKELKEDYYEITRIKYEIDVIQKEEEKELDIKEANRLLDKLNELIKRFEKLKKDFYSKNYDKINEGMFYDSYINNLISDYKEILESDNVNDLGQIKIKEIEEYIDMFNVIKEIDDSKDMLKDNLNDTKEELNITEKELDDIELEYNSMEKVNTYIDNFAKEQAQIMKDIKKKVEEKDKITKVAEYKTELILDYSKLLTSTLLIAASSQIPETKTGNMLKIGLIAFGVANLKNAVKMSTKEYKVTTKVTSIDYEKEITSSMDNVNDMDALVDKSLKNIKSMKKGFKKDFAKYKHVMPEYGSMLTKLDSLEKELIIKKKLAMTYENKLKKVLEKNNVKVKKLEEQQFN